MSEPRVWDCLMYAGEADMLEMRLHELEGKVHRHVIAEAEVTHRGHPKPLWFPAERERFAKWDGRITYVVAKELPAHMMLPYLSICSVPPMNMSIA